MPKTQPDRPVVLMLSLAGAALWRLQANVEIGGYLRYNKYSTGRGIPSSSECAHSTCMKGISSASAPRFLIVIVAHDHTGPDAAGDADLQAWHPPYLDLEHRLPKCRW